MRHLGTSRRALFEAIEHPALLAMPDTPYAYAEWRRCRVGRDYHVEVHGHFYSVPYRLMREVIEARITDQTIELFHKGDRVACHVRNPRQHRHTTIPDHMPSAQRRDADAADLGFEDRLVMLVEREALERDSKRLATRLRFAGLRQQATPEDVDHRAARGLDRALFQKLTGGEWIERHQDLLVTGPTGTGKTWLSCALGHRACRGNRSVLYQRVPRLLEALGLARGDGRYGRMLKTLARVQLLILDDWAVTPLTAEQRRDLMEIVDDRHDRASTIVTSQVPVELWHEHIGNPTIADAVLDRLVQRFHGSTPIRLPR